MCNREVPDSSGGNMSQVRCNVALGQTEQIQICYIFVVGKRGLAMSVHYEWPPASPLKAILLWLVIGSGTAVAPNKLS